MLLSMGNGFSCLQISRESHITLFLSILAQGWLLNSQFVQAIQNVALFVRVLLTLLGTALRSGSQVMAMALTRARAKSRWLKRGREALISLHLLIFPRVHQ